MAFVNSKSFSLLFVAIFAILVASQNANAQAQEQMDVNQFCQTANYKILCNRMVKDAGNLEDATTNAIQVAINAAKKVKAMTPVVVEAASSLPPDMKSQIIDECKENFDSSIDDLGLSLELLKQGDMGGVGTRLSAAFDSNCIDALKERGINVDSFNRLNSRFGNVVDNALAVAFQT